MKYYVMCDSKVVEHGTIEDAASFIETKIDDFGYRLEDFKIVQGTELFLLLAKTPASVLITNNKKTCLELEFPECVVDGKRVCVHLKGGCINK